MAIGEKQNEIQLLDKKRKALKRWALVIGILAAIAVIALGMTLLDRVLTGAPGGGLTINYEKLDSKLAWIGAEIRDLDATISAELGLTSTSGVLINDVVDDSPADKSGLQRGDVILTVNGTQVEDTLQLQEMIQDYEVGNTLKLLVDKIDSGKKLVYVKVGSKPSSTTSDTNIKKTATTTATTASQAWGISVSPLTVELREEYNIPAAEQGVVVVAVVQNSLADSQGLQVGDVIESINQVPITSLQTFYSAIDDDEGVLMDIYSPSTGKRFYVTLPDEGDFPPQVLLISFDNEVSNGRIAIASDTDNLNGIVYARFSNAPYFIIYNLNTDEYVAMPNPYAAVVRGTGITVANLVIENKVDSVIVGGIGPQSFDTFYLSEIEVYGPFNGTVKSAVAAYKLNRIPKMEEANLGGYGYNSSTAVIPTGGSPWTEETDDTEEEEGGLKSAPGTIPPMGKPEELELTAGSSTDARSNRSELCICPNCGALVTHPAGTACSDMACPICGAKLMNESPGSDTSGPTDIDTQVSSTLPITKTAAITGTFVSNSPITIPPDNVQQTASDIWYIGGQPEGVPPSGGAQLTATTTDYTTSQVTTCICPIDGTTVVHPIGVPCAALQCPVCGSRMVSGTNLITSSTAVVGGMPDTIPGMQQTAGMPTANVPTAGMPTGGMPDTLPSMQQAYYLVPVAGAPPTDMGTGSAGPAVDGTSLGGGQASTGAAQSGRSYECICPMDGTKVTHPLSVPCAALTCPLCGSRLVNAEPAGSTGGAVGALTPTAGMPTANVPTAGMPTGGMPDTLPGAQQVYYLMPVTSQPTTIAPGTQQVQQVAYLPVAGAPPTDMGSESAGPAVDGTSLGGGQAGSGAAQSGRSYECICPMDGTTVTHPIGVPCASLTCPICGSRLVNAEPAGSTGGAVGGSTLTSLLPVASSQIISVASVSRKIAIPSTGRSLTSEIAQLFDKAPYFIMFGLGKYDVVRNPYYRDDRATGAEIAQYVVGEGGAVVICNNISMTAAKAFKDLQVKVYSGFTGTVQQAIDIYADGRLKDTGTITGLVVDGSSDEDHGDGGGGPPTSKSKSKEKEEDANIY